MHKYIRTLSSILAITTSLLLIFLVPTTALAWGDNGGMRPSYTIEQINNGAIGATQKSDGEDYKNSANYPGQIIFNTISDSVIGDEKNFVGARQCILRNDGRAEPADPGKKEWRGNDITAVDGAYYIIRLYVHNNNPNGMDAVAEDTRVCFSIPNTSDTMIQVNGFISSSNAVPSEYWDYINFNSEDGTPFHLEYILGSALLENNDIGLGGLTLSDEVVQAKNGGVLIGYDALDGRIPGCYQYDNFVSIKVKVVYDYKFTIEAKVRSTDSEDATWKDTVDAKVGDKVEFQLTYKNTSETQQNNVMIRDVLPNNLRYVENSTKLKNSTYPNGFNIADGEPNDILNGINIGNYAPDANAKIIFTTEVINNSLDEGSNTLVNWGQAGVGSTTLQDYARVHIQIKRDMRLFIIITIVLGTALLLCLSFICVLLYRMYHWRQNFR